MKKNCFLIIVGLLLLYYNAFSQNICELDIYSNEIVWANGKHCAFTNLVRYNNDIYLSLREGEVHAPKTESEYGSIRILKYYNNQWKEFAYISDSRNEFSSLNFINHDVDHISWIWKVKWYNETAWCCLFGRRKAGFVIF
jgi:hypothetical protein